MIQPIPPADRPQPLGERVSRFLFGGFLATHGAEERKLGTFEAVPAMGLDGLGSSAYGPEAALTVLLPLGAGGLAAVGPIMLLLVALLAVLYVSYRQTVLAYPSNGGAYSVSKVNLGTGASLLAAAALMVDYVLNVAVGISAGIGALISAVPALAPYTLALCLVVLAALTLVNLRGTLDGGRLFALPTYLFILCFVVVIVLGAWATLRSGGHPAPVVAPPAIPAATETLGLWLFLRAFAAGCTAMTGVEAVSNGVAAFRQPVVERAHNTLTVIVVTLGFLLLGIGTLARAYNIDAMDQSAAGYQSVLSQLVGAVVGRGWFYDVAIGSLLCILCLSANTSFVDFPRLCRLVAKDGFLPRPFAVAGRRLVFSVGVLYLAATAALLLIAFGGITDRLIPLFAIGAFLTFTLSQAGMVVHWARQGARRHGLRLGVNALGAATTGVALLVILAAKFAEGAWITVIAIPAVILLLRGIHGYYARLDEQLRDEEPLVLGRSEAPLVLVATRGWDRLTDKAVRFALQISPDVIAVHLLDLDGEDDEGAAGRLRDAWERDVAAPARAAGLNPPRLMLLQATFRRIHAPLLRLVERLRRDHPDRTVAVLVPTVAKTHLWQHLLHTHNAARLGQALMRFGGDGVVVVNIPWHLEPARVDDALIPEERRGEEAAA
ncbi:APC family permease [Lichenibacterium dinghuense]|uniref:APC family permease n=1 Tax=Lichenibacterium dinghuense TaxID=2895977 RepID=UPI001F272E59|nr:APC family permease [Lichenibacterium sp. 6Y81]